MNINATFNTQEETVEVKSEKLFNWKHDTYSEWIFMTQARSTITLERSEAIRLAKLILDAAANSDYDQFLIAQYEERQDAIADAISAHWGHD